MLKPESRACDRRSGQQGQRSSSTWDDCTSVQSGAEISFAVPASVGGSAALGVPDSSDLPGDALVTLSASRRRNVLPLWRLIVVGGWVLFIGGFAIGEPAEEVARHWWVDGA